MDSPVCDELGQDRRLILFPATLNPTLMDVLLRDPRVESIEEDGIVRTLSPVTQWVLISEELLPNG